MIVPIGNTIAKAAANAVAGIQAHCLSLRIPHASRPKTKEINAGGMMVIMMSASRGCSTTKIDESTNAKNAQTPAKAQ